MGRWVTLVPLTGEGGGGRGFSICSAKASCDNNNNDKILLFARFAPTYLNSGYGKIRNGRVVDGEGGFTSIRFTGEDLLIRGRWQVR